MRRRKMSRNNGSLKCDKNSITVHLLYTSNARQSRYRSQHVKGSVHFSPSILAPTDGWRFRAEFSSVSDRTLLESGGSGETESFRDLSEQLRHRETLIRLTSSE
ncbi:hypothetical protein EVAR_49038_1 [Eumeta japonica]|uniref:Uncharacterized protein n=1 Tax=Eumeta variegata TaxID=151549 RepID=A0A4C1XP25_EUMVA|nr:hypothetical protein EVAR_49038_1 [Eumeta japonica]